jgi:Flp pilus assembly protein TadD
MTPPVSSQGSTDHRLARGLTRSALLFEAAVLERLLGEDPDDTEALSALAQVYARLGRHAEGVAVDRQLVARHPDDAVFRYNLACSLALMGDLNGACGALLTAIDRGYRDFDHLLRDDDLLALRNDTRFGLVQDRMVAARGAGSGQSA